MAINTASDLVTIFRREADAASYYPDRNFPSATTLWSNYELVNLVDLAQKEFAFRTYIFKDQQSFRPDITADDPWIKLDNRILSIVKAELASNERELPVITEEDFRTKFYTDDYGHRSTASWESRTGAIRCLINDLETGYLRAYPIPEEDDTLILTVRRLPMEDITALTDDIEIPSQYRHGLLHYVKAYAYSTPRAIIAGYGESGGIENQKWEDFLVKSRKQVQIRTRGPGQVRYGGIR